MNSILTIPDLIDPEYKEVDHLFEEYQKYIQSIQSDLPEATRLFATAPWHYDSHDHRCPHDAWVESLIIREPTSGTRFEKRHLEIHVRLLGAYHDGYINLHYRDVRSYQLATSYTMQTATIQGIGHGDWLIDEVQISPNNLVLHKIRFSHAGLWIIECADIAYQWEPKDNTVLL